MDSSMSPAGWRLPFLGNFGARIPDRPVIVLGNQKSGTSAIAHLLADHGGLTKTIDIPPLWGKHGVEVILGRRDFRSVVEKNRRYFASGLIKEPMMTFFPDQVLEVFPGARIVFIVRDPRDNIRSLLDRRDLPGNLRTLAPEDVPRKLVLDPEVWGGKGENYVGVLSHRWNKALDGYFRFQDRMTLAQYEDFEADKPGFIASLAARLGIPGRADISDRVDIPYQRAGNRSVTWLEFFGQDNLAAIHRICGERMIRIGYEIASRP